MAVMNGMEVGCITDVLRLVPICNTKSMPHCSGKVHGTSNSLCGRADCATGAYQQSACTRATNLIQAITQKQDRDPHRNGPDILNSSGPKYMKFI